MSTNPNILALHNKEVTASPSSKGNDDNSYLDSNNPLFIMMMLYSKIIKQSAVSQWTQALIDESKQQDLNAIQNKLDDLLSQLKNITDESNSLIDKFKKMPLWEKIAIITAVVVVAVVAVAAMAGVASMIASYTATAASTAATAATTAAGAAAAAEGTTSAAIASATAEAAAAEGAATTTAATTADIEASVSAAQTEAATASQAATAATNNAAMLQASGASSETVEAAQAEATTAQQAASRAAGSAARSVAAKSGRTAEEIATAGETASANTTFQASNMARVAGYVGNGISRIFISPVALPAGAGYLTYQLLPGGDWHQESYTVYNSDGKKDNVTGTQSQANEALQKEQTYISTEMSNASQKQDTTNAGMKKDSSFIDNQESLQNASSENIQKAILTYKDIYVVHAV